MKAETALRLLARVMDWTDEAASHEFSFLRIMARLKYDDYRDFLAGMRFLESLVAWLQQFDMADRAAAYDFVRNRLVFISAAERQRLVEMLFPNTIWPELVQSAMRSADVPSWRVLVDAAEHVKRDLRCTLFLALSDGARMDTFRHANVGRISNEQVVVTVEPSNARWDAILAKLRKEYPDANFTRIVLVDDFTASGTSLIRREEDGTWDGKLKRFLVSANGANIDPFDLMIHHLIGTSRARDHIEKEIAAYRAEEPEIWSKVRDVKPTYGHEYADSLSLSEVSDAPFIALAKKYYDPGISNSHTDKGGTRDISLGYGGCAVPIVLDHNTPNNSVALLWAESEPAKCSGRPMRPLFRRRQRHS